MGIPQAFGAPIPVENLLCCVFGDPCESQVELELTGYTAPLGFELKSNLPYQFPDGTPEGHYEEFHCKDRDIVTSGGEAPGS